MEIFGKEIAVKSHGCNVMDEPGQRIVPSVNLFVKVTKGCNAHCKFCSNANSTDASSVMLHFEIRYRGNSVNPRKYLP